MLLDDNTAGLTESCLNTLNILNEINYSGITQDLQFEIVEELIALKKRIHNYIKQLPVPDIKYMVDHVLRKLEQSKPRFVNEFKTTKFEDLVIYHHTIGEDIRAEFKLWVYPWIPMIGKDGVDHSPNHPDAISMRVIEEVWRQIKNDEESTD